MLKKLILKLIRFYQKWISIDQSVFFKNSGIKVCIYEPYCSEYTHQAIHKYGILKGGFMGIKRIIRCNPFSKGGYDPVK